MNEIELLKEQKQKFKLEQLKQCQVYYETTLITIGTSLSVTSEPSTHSQVYEPTLFEQMAL